MEIALPHMCIFAVPHPSQEPDRQTRLQTVHFELSWIPSKTSIQTVVFLLKTYPPTPNRVPVTQCRVQYLGTYTGLLCFDLQTHWLIPSMWLQLPVGLKYFKVTSKTFCISLSPSFFCQFSCSVIFQIQVLSCVLRKNAAFSAVGFTHIVQHWWWEFDWSTELLHVNWG